MQSRFAEKQRLLAQTLYFQHECRIKSLVLEQDYHHYIPKFSVLGEILTICFYILRLRLVSGCESVRDTFDHNQVFFIASETE